MEGGMKAGFFLQKGKPPPSKQAEAEAIRPCRWNSGQAEEEDGRRKKKDIRNKKKQEAGRMKGGRSREKEHPEWQGIRKTEDGRKHMEKSCKAPHQASVHQASGQTEGSRAGRASGIICFPLEIISIVSYRPFKISVQK